MDSFIQENVPGSALCSMRVGGTIARVARPETVEQLEMVMGEGALILGGGSNVLLPDEGYEGAVIIPSNKIVTIERDKNYPEKPTVVDARYSQEIGRGFLELEGTDFSGEPVYCTFGAGLPWGQAVMKSFTEQCVGLQWYARIPCAVGGAIYNNIHGEKHLLSEVIQEVVSYKPGEGFVRRLPSQCEFGYDTSIFHKEKEEVIWEVVFRLEHSPETVAAAQAQYLDWTKAKSVAQPAGANCGSVFQNLEPVEGLPSVAAGWYVDHAGCRGWNEGPMRVSDKHANFITNEGGGTQAQFIALVERIRERVKKEYKIILLPEFECITKNGTKHQW